MKTKTKRKTKIEFFKINNKSCKKLLGLRSFWAVSDDVMVNGCLSLYVSPTIDWCYNLKSNLLFNL